jgi:predicted RNase H-like HicB family nuclease
MKSYVFKVVFEKDKWPDEPVEKAIWRVYIPSLPSAHAWGDTKSEMNRSHPMRRSS